MFKSNMLSYENKLLAVLFLTFGFVFFDRLALPFLFPFMQDELKLSNTQLGLLSSILALSWSISGALVGAWSDKRGKRKAPLIIAVILFSLCSALSELVLGFISLLIFRAIMGLAEGPILPLSQSMMVDASSTYRRGLNMGLLQGSAAGLFGAIIAPPAMVFLAQWLGWRHAFVISLIPGLIIAVLLWLVVQKDGSAHHMSKVEDKKTGQEDSNDHGIHLKRWDLLKNHNVLLCTFISCVFVAWFIVIMELLDEDYCLSRERVRRRMHKLNQAWVCDITYIRVNQQWLYLAIVLDLYSRKIIDWAMDTHMQSSLVCQALTMAMLHRGYPSKVVVHSGRGGQYCSDDYQAILTAYGLKSSMSRKGNCWDNAVAESFFHTLKTE